MPTSEIALLAGTGLFIVAVWGGAGWLVLQRVREQWDRPHHVLAVVVLLLWPIVLFGVEVGWLLGLNEWHFRPDR